jgi:hypothetical protein
MGSAKEQKPKRETKTMKIIMPKKSSLAPKIIPVMIKKQADNQQKN